MLPVSSRILHTRLSFFLFTLFCISIIISISYAGTTGKIVGKITEKDTGEPIIGANVQGVNQTWGAATDMDGEFTILNISPGIYELEISHVEYHTITMENVNINIDLTTELDIELTVATMKLEEARVKVVKKIIEIGTSDSRTRIDAAKIKDLRPEDVTTLIKTVPGFKQDEEGSFHVRGSRKGEVAFIVDGVDFRDPLVSTITNISLGSQNISEVNILTGGFSAEYGRAMGAIVQITTAEGPEKSYTGRFEYQTDRVFDDYSFDTDRGEFALGGPVPYSKKFIGKPVTFFFTTIGKITNTYTPFDINRPANDYMGLGVKLPERQINNYSSSLKLAYKLTDTKKLSLYLTESFNKWDIYPNGEGGISGNYGYAYKYNLENRPSAENRQFSATLTYTNQISSKTFYEIKFITFTTHSKVNPGNISPGDVTLQEDVENDIAFVFDINRNGKLDPEEYFDFDGNGFMDGYIDANGNRLFDGGGEGYEDLNQNGRWDRGEDWVDINGNGIYDAAEPWIDVVNPLTGENNLGVYDSWDTYSDVNGNGRWDAAEPQLTEQDWNKNGIWDGERFNDANGNGIYDAWEPWIDLNGNYLWDEGEPYTDTNGNGRFDYSEGYDDKNNSGEIDTRDLQERITDPDVYEPFIDGDFWWDTGEPFIDEPDPITGEYNGSWDAGEIFFDLPSSLNLQTYAGYLFLGTDMTLNGRYDGPNLGFDEYELFTKPADWSFNSDPSRPIVYTFDEEARGRDWPDSLYKFIQDKSTWVNRTLHDTDSPYFDFRNFSCDTEKEWWVDYNGDGKWNSADRFLNPDVWDENCYWYDRVSTEYTLKFDIQSQVTKYHEMKSGFEMKFRKLKMQAIQEPDLPYTGEAELPEGSPWPDRGGSRDFYEYNPYEGAVYVQDKMEFEGLIVNAGIRYDFIIHDPDIVDEFRRRLENEEPGAIMASRGTSRTSPRLGISHPITETSKLYFNYGHFYQAPQFQYFYRAATANFDVESTIGNPNLEYEKTVQYELGVNTMISDYVVIDVSGYYKDQYDLISTSDERWKNLTLDRYVNLDYGRMRGFELSIEKRPSHHYAFTLNYDYSYAYGKASDQHANRDARLMNQPYNWDEHPLNWDETHKINAYLTLHFDRGEHPQLLGFVMPDDWMMTLQWAFGSGLPYTPSRYLVGVDNQNLVLPNSARRPWHETTTIKFEKYYIVSKKSNNRMFFGFTINNLFNKRNVAAVYTQTGNPEQQINPLNPAYNPFDNRADFDANPRNYGPSRNVHFRVGITF